MGQGGATVDVRLAPLDLVHATRATLGLSPLLWPRPAGMGALLDRRLRSACAALGLPAAVRALREGPAAAAALASMSIAAWPLGLLFRVSAPDVLPGQTVVNDAAYLVEQGGALLWIFTAVALARNGPRGGRARLVLPLARAAGGCLRPCTSR